MLRRLCCCCFRHDDDDGLGLRTSSPLLSNGCLLPLEAWIQPPESTTRGSSGSAPPPPPTVLEPCELHELMAKLPYHLQGRLLTHIYSTTANGYSNQTLRRKCEGHSSPHAKPSLLVINTVGGVKLGAYLSCLPQWGTHKPFVGTPETFVFCFRKGSPEVTIFPGNDGEGGNRNFLRCEEGAVHVGSGPNGPALLITKNMTRVSSAPDCPTFKGYSGSMLGEIDSADLTSLPGDATRGTVVSSVELWLISEELSKGRALVQPVALRCSHGDTCPHRCSGATA